jgi:hypothetical protein
MFRELHLAINGANINSLDVYRKLCELSEDELEWCISSLQMDVKELEYDEAYNLLWVLIMATPGLRFIKGKSTGRSTEDFCTNVLEEDLFNDDGEPSVIDDQNYNPITMKLTAKQGLDLAIAASYEELVQPPFIMIEWAEYDDDMIKTVLSRDRKYCRENLDDSETLKEVYTSCFFKDVLFFPDKDIDKVAWIDSDKGEIPEVNSMEMFMAIFMPDFSLIKDKTHPMEIVEHLLDDDDDKIYTSNLWGSVYGQGYKFIGKYREFLRYNVALYNGNKLDKTPQFIK